jgi:hypothetical protein
MLVFNRKNRNKLIFIPVVLLLVLSDTHVFSHVSNASDSNDCELCTILSISNDWAKPSVLPVKPSKAIMYILDNPLLSLIYETPLRCFVSPRFMHNKPPPILV